MPATHKKAPRPARPAQAGGRPGGGEGTYRAPRGDRDDYRRRDDGAGGGDKEGAGGGFRPRYAGVGRGAPAAE